MLDAMAPWASDDRYMNFAERGGWSGLQTSVRARLQAVRRAWDPERRFVGSHAV